MTEYDKYRRGDVVRAMFAVTDTPDEFERLYLTSASFKSGVDVLVGSLIPIFLRGLSHEADQRDRLTQEAMQEKMRIATQVETDPRWIMMFGHEKKEDH